MADLNNTIVRGKLRVTEDINANGNITGSSITLSNIKNVGILGTDSSGKVYDNSSKYQKAGDYATKSDLNKYQPAGNYQPKGDYVTTDTTQSISGQKIFDTTPVLPKIKGAKVIGTNAKGLIEAQTLTKNDVGLENVDNTADSQKYVKYADNAGGLMEDGAGISFEGI